MRPSLFRCVGPRKPTAMKRLLLTGLLLAPMAHAQTVRITGRVLQPDATVELHSYFDDRAESLRQLAGGSLAGLVVDEAGRPIAGAEIDMNPFADGPTDTYGIRSATTGSDGRFRFADLPRGHHLDLWIDHPGFVELQVSQVEIPTPQPLRIQLVKARSLKGRVVDPEGQPVAEARVALVETAAGRLLGGGFGTGAWGSSQARTDADGRFVLDRLPPETIGIGVRAIGFRNKSLAGISIPEEGEAPPVEISLEPGPFLEGRVLDSQGRPAPRAMIRAEGSLQGDGRFSFGGTRTDDKGHYQIGGLEPGPHTVTVHAEEGSPATRAAVEIVVGPNRLDLSLPAGVEVSGRVVDARGAPVAGAFVSLLGSFMGSQAVSSSDGSFVIRDIPEGDYRLIGERHGFGRTEAPEAIRVGGDPVQGLELRLSPGAVIRGRVLGMIPADRDRIRVMIAGGSGFFPPPVEVSAEGDYRIPDIPPGTWTVLVQGASEVLAEEEVQVADGDQEIVLDLEIPAPER